MEFEFNLEIDKLIRENKILKIQEGNPIASGAKLPINVGKTFDIYRVPLDLLLFNHLNDRFASRRREFISETGTDLKTDDLHSQKVIMDFIWESNPKRNDETLKDILKNKQQKYGVITRDGRIIDGNRRVRILKQIYYSKEGTYSNIDKENFKYFEAIILPDDINDTDIQLLETRLQMGEDEKVDYNAIEKYLKIDKLKTLGMKYEDIAGLITSVESGKKAEEMQGIYKLMCDYLTYIGEEERFSLISKMEDHFIKLYKTLSYYEKGTYNVSWNPDDYDVLDLKTVAFNYIRVGYEGKAFRNIMGGQRDNKGVFSNKAVWQKFKEKHDKFVDDLEKKVKSKENKNEFNNVEEKESFYKEIAKIPFESYLKQGKEALDNKAASNEPKKLAEEALDKLDSIDIDFFIDNFDKSAYKFLQEIEKKIGLIKDRVLKDVFDKRK